MKYLAIILLGSETYSQSFNTTLDAMNWLDSNNNNGELTTIIEEYNDKWQKTGSYFYTRSKE